MKRLIYLFLTVFVLVGCETKEEFYQIVQDNWTESELPQNLYATILNEENAQQSRTLVNNRKVVWHEKDEISFFVNNIHARYQSDGKANAEHVTFTKLSEKTVNVQTPPRYSLAVYPYDENITCEKGANGDVLHVTYPAVQTYAQNSFGKGANLMIAAGTIPGGTDSNLRFRNACGYLVLKLYGENSKVKTITLSSRSGEKIAGAATVVAKSNAAPATTMDDGATSTVTLNCGDEGVAIGADAAHATEFWFALPPVTFAEGIRVVVEKTDGTRYTKETTNSVTVERNTIKPMAALHAVNQILYTTYSGAKLTFEDDEDPFNVDIKTHEYVDGRGVIIFKDNLTTIKKEAFEDKDITTIEIPETVTTIEEKAFYDAEYLTELTIPGSVNYIGFAAFGYCEALTHLTFEPSPTETPLDIVYSYVGTFVGTQGPFADSRLKYINVNRQLNYKDEVGNPYTVAQGAGLLSYKVINSQLETVIIGPQLKNISDYMFERTYLSSITIPATVETIGKGAFYLNQGLKTLNFEESENPIVIQSMDNGDGPFYKSPLQFITLKRDVTYKDNGGNIYIPDSSDEGLFSNTYKLQTKVTLGGKFTIILPYMFSETGVGAAVDNNGNFRDIAGSLWIPNTIKSIGDNAFYDCDWLAGLTLGYDGLTDFPSIGTDVFTESDNFYYIKVRKRVLDDFNDKVANNLLGWKNYADKITSSDDFQ